MLIERGTNKVESAEAFCLRVSERLSDEGFEIEVHPGIHLVDDAGADSLSIFYYVLLLQEFGLEVDLSNFDTDLLDIDVAYNTWIRNN